MKLSALSLAALLLAGPVAATAQDLDTSLQNLKEAEAKKDTALVKKLAAETSKLAGEVLQTPAPTNAEEKDNWTKRIAYAKDVKKYSDYSIYALAVQSPPETTVDLFSTLERQNPKSEYLDEGYARYILAMSQTGATAKVPEMAEKALANFPDNEDLLQVMANTAWSRKQIDRALTYSNRLVAAMNKHSKPESMSAADWERRRSIMLGRGYWMSGLIYGDKGQYALADKNLRAALPFIKGDQGMAGPALFTLGLSNYQLGKMTNNKARVLEGAKFSDQASKIEGGHQQQAWRNAKLMSDEAAKMR